MFDLFEKWDGTQRQEEADKAAAQSNSSYSQGTSVQSSYSQYSQPQGARKLFVLSVGGSVFFNEKLRAPEISKFCEAINELKREGYGFVLVVGGGRVARVYQAGAKALGANNFLLDEVGIAITRANALMFTQIIDDCWQDILVDPKQADNVLLLGKTPIFGGTTPGQTTDSVAAIVAELLNAEFINLSNVDGIFSADPVKEPAAKMYRELSHTKMLSLIKAQASKPGAHSFTDPHAASILQRSKIRACFVNGNDLENFKSCVRGMEFKGTIVASPSQLPLANEVEAVEGEE